MLGMYHPPPMDEREACWVYTTLLPWVRGRHAVYIHYSPPMGEREACCVHYSPPMGEREACCA